MEQQQRGKQGSSSDAGRPTRNPFGVMDVPNPNDQVVVEFAARAELAASSDDENGKAWTAPSCSEQHDRIEAIFADE